MDRQTHLVVPGEQRQAGPNMAIKFQHNEILFYIQRELRPGMVALAHNPSLSYMVTLGLTWAM